MNLESQVGRRLRSAFAVTAGLAVLCIAGWCVVSALRYVDQGAAKVDTSKPKGKVLRRTLAENVRVTDKKVRGVDLVSCGVCRLEKRKTGLLTLGGMNVLVLEDLSVVIPQEEEGVGERAEGDAAGDAADIARRLGVSGGFLSSRGLPVKFSGLRISRLKVDRLASGEVQQVFRAASAKAVKGGLSLSGCEVALPSGGTSLVGKALLAKKGNRLRLSWAGGEREI